MALPSKVVSQIERNCRQIVHRQAQIETQDRELLRLRSELTGRAAMVREIYGGDPEAIAQLDRLVWQSAEPRDEIWVREEPAERVSVPERVADVADVPLPQSARPAAHRHEVIMPSHQPVPAEPVEAATGVESSAAATPAPTSSEPPVAAPSEPALPVGYRWRQNTRRDAVLQTLFELGGATMEQWRRAVLENKRLPSGAVFQGYVGALKKLGVIARVGARWVPTSNVAL